ncbi:MAG: hypothetical protein PHD30_05540 [Paludibacter sp.]|nr:hypothetical protein [Paludibacter sp.]
MKTYYYYYLIFIISILFSGCDKITGGYYCIKNDTQYDIKIEHIGDNVHEKEFNIAPSQVYKAFWGSPDFETVPYSTDTFYIAINNKIYMDTYNLLTSLTRLENYVYDRTEKKINSETSYSIFTINEDYLNSLIEIK